jgi:uncharacterized membrane protein HdeD (DUF308 family)
MDVLQYVLLGTVIAGVNELIKRLRAKDYWTALTIVCSALIGLVFGVFGIEGLNPVTGIAAGFGLSGAMSVLGSIGNKSTPAPSDAVVK